MFEYIIFHNKFIILLKKDSYPKNNFSFLDIYKKYNENPEFINILKTEYRLNFIF